MPPAIPKIVIQGVERALPILPGPITARPRYGDYFPVFSVETLTNMALGWNLPILDQGPHSSCGGFSSAQAIMAAHAERAGGEIVRLSGTYLYSLTNGGQDQGSQIQDLLAAAEQHGCCPLADFPESNLFRGQGSPQADQDALRFRVEAAYSLHSFEEILTAIYHRNPTVVGVPVGSNFDQVDAEDICPPIDAIRGGHALYRDEIYHSATKGWCVGGPNQWGISYGVKGRCRLPQSYFTNSQWPIQSFCIASLVPDPLSDDAKAVG